MHNNISRVDRGGIIRHPPPGKSVTFYLIRNTITNGLIRNTLLWIVTGDKVILRKRGIM